MINKSIFDNYNGQEIYKYTLSDNRLQADIITFGATVTALRVNTGKNWVDVALGFESVEDQIKKGDYMGAVAGRCANRIEDGRFTLNGKQYTLDVNNGTNHLHGGFKGFDKQIYQDSTEEGKLMLRYYSKDGDQGYCGNVDFCVTYSVEYGALNIEYRAVSDQDTLFNVTNHLYFNLNGQEDGSILDNMLMLNADSYTPDKPNLIPTGEIASVDGTPFDFTVFKAIGQDIGADNEQLKIAGGYDHNFCLNSRHAGTAYSVKTGIVMDVYTDRPGIQFYSGNFLSGNVGKSCYKRNSGFCLETQCYPNAVNQAGFPSPVLKAGEKFVSRTSYKFSLRNN